MTSKPETTIHLNLKQMNKSGITCFAIVLILMGCKISSPYQAADLKMPSSFYKEDTTASSGTFNLPNAKWNEMFSDTVLVGVINTALQNNIDLKIADEYVAMGVSQFKQAKAGLLPSISANPFKYRRDIYGENYNNWGSNRSRRIHGADNIPRSFYTERLEYETSLSLSWELDIWKKLSRQKRAAQLDYMQTLEFKKAVQTSLIADISNAYAALLLTKSQLEIYHRNLSLTDSTYRIVSLQYDAGEVTSLAVKQTKSQKLRAQTLIPQLESDYIQQENKLNMLIGRYAQPIEVGLVDWTLASDDFMLGAPLELLANRPDVAAAEYKLRESYELVGVANAMRYPSITLGASTGLNSFQLEHLLNPVGSGLLLLNGAIFQPIFQQRKLKTNYELAMSEMKIAELEFKDTFFQAMAEVSDALIKRKKLQEEYTLAVERVDVAKSAMNDASLLFRSGLANYLEVITAQSEALDSELNLEKIKMSIFITNVELYRSLGGGWK